MLAPHPDDAINRLTALFNAGNAVTQWVNALVGADLPPLSPLPSWYTTLGDALQTAQTDAQVWLDTTGPDMLAQMTTANDYNDLFAVAAKDLRRLVKKIGENDPPYIPNAGQLQDLIGYVQALQQQAAVELAAVQTAQSAAQTYLAQVQADHDALGTALGAAVAQESTESAAIGQVQLQIASLQATIAGLTELADSKDISGGEAIAALIVSIVVGVSGGTLSLMTVAAGIVGVGADFGEGILQNQQVQADVQQLQTLSQQLSADQQQLGMLQGVVSCIQSLLASNDQALSTFSGLADLWAFEHFRLTYLLVVLAQPQIDVSTIPDLNDLGDAAAAWEKISDFATAAQEATITQQPGVSIAVQVPTSN
jgi:Bacillus haemolytic enterotoxin (HBL)